MWTTSTVRCRVKDRCWATSVGAVVRTSKLTVSSVAIAKLAGSMVSPVVPASFCSATS